MSKAAKTTGCAGAAAGTENLAFLVSPKRTLLRLAGACVAGLLLSIAFPPLEWDVAIWVGLVPLMLVPRPAGRWRRVGLGYLFGLTHAVSSLYWLNEVGFFAGFLLSLPVACFHALWYLGICGAIDRLGDGNRPTGWFAAVTKPVHQCLAALAAASLWVSLEWLRGWVFTGFPWNGLGVSQWQRPAMLGLAPIAGIHGVSFLIVFTNAAILFAGVGAVQRFRGEKIPRFSAVLGLAVLLFAVCIAARLAVPGPGTPSAYLRILAIQGNIPQCREYTPGQFEEALSVYTDLTRAHAPVSRPDIVVWPETAVPAPLGYPPYLKAVRDLQRDTGVPLLLGTVDYRTAPGSVELEDGSREPPDNCFNSAFLVDGDGMVAESYDKIRIVPFGEFTPFEDHLPWLVRIIGMGRSLTRGKAYHVFSLPKGARAGVNICFEDVFSDVSRQFVLRGANLLVTITNDAWYAESAGSRQHMVHAVWRAAETRRPLFRSGNNSDTCLILPDGQVTDLLYEPVTGNPFIRAAKVYEVPVYPDPPLTPYTRYGDVFAAFCVLGGLLTVGIPAAMRMREKARLLKAVSPEAE